MLKHIPGPGSTLQAAMPTTIMSSPDKVWYPNPYLSDFQRAHWGVRGRALLNEVFQRPLLERFLDIWPTSALSHLGVSVGTPHSSLLVREEMMLFSQRFLDARDCDLETPIDGVVLLGQSGIGKTVLLVFFLLQCLSREEPVLFTTRHGSTYLFNEHGAVAMKASKFVASEHLPYRVDRHGAPRLWSLVDCPISLGPSPLSVALDAKPQVFFIAALCPHQSRYKPFERDLAVRTWWMSRWSDEELLPLLRCIDPAQINTEHRERYQTFDADAVRSLREAAGPVPRDIFRFLSDPCGYNAHVTEETTYSCLPPFISLVFGTGGVSNEYCDHVTFVGRAGMLSTPTELGNDVYDVSFKTRAAGQRMMDRLERLSLEESRVLCERCGLQSRAIRHPGFAGIVFESLARQYTSGAFGVEADTEDAASLHAPSGMMGLMAPGEVFHHQFTPMVLAQGTSRSHTMTRFVFLQNEAEARRTTLVVDKDRRITWSLSNDSDRSSLLPSLPSPAHPNSRFRQVASEPWAARRRVAFENIEQLAVDIGIDDASYYCPAAYPRAAFDAFFFQVLPGLAKVVLWAVLIASKREDGASDSSGFEMVGLLRERAQGTWSGAAVEVNYALVIPYDPALGFNVEWEFGDGFEEHGGEVYIQHLDICGLCRVEDIFGVPVPMLEVGDAPA